MSEYALLCEDCGCRYDSNRNHACPATSPKTLGEVCNQPPGSFSKFCAENPEPEKEVKLSEPTGSCVHGYIGQCPICSPQPSQVASDSFQARVRPWLIECFGQEIADDVSERCHRFLEEALETVQAHGCTSSEAHQLVDYVYARPVGEPAQEVGGVMVTLAALCLAAKLDMHKAGEIELARIWTKVEKIRAKQAAKPKHSPLPEQVASEGKSLGQLVCNLLDAMQAVYHFTEAEGDYIARSIVSHAVKQKTRELGELLALRDKQAEEHERATREKDAEIEKLSSSNDVLRKMAKVKDLRIALQDTQIAEKDARIKTLEEALSFYAGRLRPDKNGYEFDEETFTGSVARAALKGETK